MNYAPIAIKERAIYLYLFGGYTYGHLEEILAITMTLSKMGRFLQARRTVDCEETSLSKGGS